MPLNLRIRAVSRPRARPRQEEDSGAVSVCPTKERPGHGSAPCSFSPQLTRGRSGAPSRHARWVETPVPPGIHSPVGPGGHLGHRLPDGSVPTVHLHWAG